MNYPTTNLVVYDLEVFPNFFQAGFEFPDGIVHQYVNDLPGMQHLLNHVRREGYTLAGFNSQGYDDLVWTAAMQEKDPYEVSREIIQGDQPRWTWDNYIQSIDLMQILPGRIGLKKIGICLGHKKLQELPIPYDKEPTEQEKDIILSYNRNDLEITRKLVKEVQEELDLRGMMSRVYDIDLRSKGEATMAEIAIMAAYWDRGGRRTKKDFSIAAKGTVAINPFAKVTPPSWWMDYTHRADCIEVVALGESIFANSIPLIDGRLASGVLDKQVAVGDRFYATGVGGLHSVDGPGCWIPNDDEIMMDIDVASYYPSLILTQKLYPRHWGDEFLQIYSDIVQRRMEAKRAGDTTTAAVLKITANGTYGKTSDLYSALYDPQMTANVTITGQLALLILISLFEGTANVVSANTDGMTVICKRADQEKLKAIVAGWEKTTGLEMEFTDYSALYQRDVNNYMAVKVNGDIKAKGRFINEWPDLRHTPNANIVATALHTMVYNGTPLRDTIEACTDLNQFILSQAVTGQWKTSWQGADQGKILRFYKSTSPGAAPIVRTPGEGDKGKEGIVTNSNSCIPVPDLPTEFPNHIDYDWYVQEAQDLLDKVNIPKRKGLTRWANTIHNNGLRPCMVNPEKSPSYAKVKYGEVDFSSMPEGWVMGSGTGKGLMAKVEDGVTTFHTTQQEYPSRTRKVIQKHQGFTLYYGPKVSLENTAVYEVQAELPDLDDYYTPAELRRVGR